MARVIDIREVRDQRIVYGLPLDGRVSPYHPYSYEPTVEMTITARPHEVQALRSVVGRTRAELADEIKLACVESVQGA